jgi:hypothetical protein
LGDCVELEDVDNLSEVAEGSEDIVEGLVEVELFELGEEVVGTAVGDEGEDGGIYGGGGGR